MNHSQTEVNIRFHRDLEKDDQLIQKQLMDKTQAYGDGRNQPDLADQILFKAGLPNQRFVQDVSCFGFESHDCA
jgi:hypothetical protein